MGGWAEDGKTYYIGQSFRGVGGIMPIIDVADPYNAKWLLNWTFTVMVGPTTSRPTRTARGCTRATRQLRRGAEQFFVRAGRAGDPGRERHPVPSS
jgi:hypothetical protein